LKGLERWGIDNPIELLAAGSRIASSVDDRRSAIGDGIIVDR
jgi:hypothetical protein